MIFKINIKIGHYYFNTNILAITLVLLSVAFLSSLGMWQYHRYQQKTVILQRYAEQTAHVIHKIAQPISDKQDLDYQKVELIGHFTERQIFLDNRTYQGQPGYEVVTVFFPSHSKTAILIDRGWVAAEKSRQNLPNLTIPTGKITLTGVLHQPTMKPFLLASHDIEQIGDALRTQAIQIRELSSKLNLKLYPYVLILDKDSAESYVYNWQPVILSPARHLGYMVQWFGLAIALVVVFFAASLKRDEKERTHV